MNDPENDRPPRYILAFFRWFCNPAFREDIEGDLLEQFNNRRLSLGSRRAKWMFSRDVLLLFRPGIIRNLYAQRKFLSMKNSDWRNLVAINILLMALIISPFLPGPSTRVVIGLSIAGQLAGTFGLLLVPIGLVWTIIEIRKSGRTMAVNQKSHYNLAIFATALVAVVFLLGIVTLPNPMPKVSALIGLLMILAGFGLGLRQIRKWKENNESPSDHGTRIILAISAIAVFTFTYLFGVLGIFVGLGIIPGIAGALFFSTLLFWIIKKIRKLKDVNETKSDRLPIYLLTIPLTAFFTFMYIVKPASDFSRDFAIKNGEALIASIEDHKNRTGRYPESLQELYAHTENKIPQPSIMGIEDFRYNKINDRYSLSFSQWLDLGSLEEIVLYDKYDLKNNLTGELAKYDYRSDLSRAKAAFASHDTGYKFWRYYLCD